MVKTTIYLPEDLKRAVERAAHARGCREAVVVRDALRQFTSAIDAARPKLPLFSSGKPGLAERVDAALRGFGTR